MREFFFAICLFGLVAQDVVAQESPEHFLSFIMPCFNCSKTMKESIDSIYEQNIMIPFEVVCTDDASTDNTVEILRVYEEKYDNFYVY